jgi:hypothetical protein
LPESGALPADPLKSSLKAVDQPAGGPGTSALAAGAATVMVAANPNWDKSTAPAINHRRRPTNRNLVDDIVV